MVQKINSELSAETTAEQRTNVDDISVSPACIKPNVRRSVTITIPLDVAETLQGYIDGGIGTSGDDEFVRQMKIILKRLDRQVLKHYA